MRLKQYLPRRRCGGRAPWPPESARRRWDVGDGVVESVSNCIQARFQIWHGSSLADDVVVESVAAINAKAGADVVFDDDGAWAAGCPKDWAVSR